MKCKLPLILYCQFSMYVFDICWKKGPVHVN